MAMSRPRLIIQENDSLNVVICGGMATSMNEFSKTQHVPDADKRCLKMRMRKLAWDCCIMLGPAWDPSSRKFQHAPDACPLAPASRLRMTSENNTTTLLSEGAGQNHADPLPALLSKSAGPASRTTAIPTTAAGASDLASYPFATASVKTSSHLKRLCNDLPR